MRLAALLPDGYIKEVAETSRRLSHRVQGHSGFQGHHGSEYPGPLPCGAGAAAAHTEGQEEAGDAPVFSLKSASVGCMG